MAFDYRDLDYPKIMGAEVITTFVQSPAKCVELVRDGDDEFVRRQYYPPAVEDIEGCNLPFVDAWQTYGTLLDSVGINRVAGGVFHDGYGQNPVIACEYVSGSPVAELPKNDKTDLVANMSELAFVSPWFMPEAQGLASDGVIVVDGVPTIIDVDPYLKPKHTGLGSNYDRAAVNAATIAFMNSMANNIEEWSGRDPEHRKAMARAAVGVFGEHLDDAGVPDLDAIKYFTHLHDMTDGTPLEEIRAKWRD